MNYTFSEKEFKNSEKEEKSLSLFEKFGGTYSQIGDYLLPNIALKCDEKAEVLGKYGMMRKNYLKIYIPVGYNILASRNELYYHCKEVEKNIEEQLNQIMSTLVNKAKTDGVLPEKSTKPIEWAAMMNSLKAQAEEIVLPKLLYEFI